MERALGAACAAAERGEVPVGCVIVSPDGVVLAETGNRCEADRDPTAHAELLAIRAAAQTLGSPRLAGCDLYVTLEPCAMCAGAIAHADDLSNGKPGGYVFDGTEVWLAGRDVKSVQERTVEGEGTPIEVLDPRRRA